MVTNTGKNLNIIILCDYVPHHCWMTFLSWYSLNKYLPEAKIIIVCNRELMSHQLFDWTKKANVAFLLKKRTQNINHVFDCINKNLITFPVLAISPDILCIRDLNDSLIFDEPFMNRELFYLKDHKIPSKQLDFIVDVKNSNFATFITYKNGWGKFVLSEWINKDIHPLSPIWNYQEKIMTSNESKMYELWKESTPLFLALKG